MYEEAERTAKKVEEEQFSQRKLMLLAAISYEQNLLQVSRT
jgi:hypothetical protein